MQHVRIFLLKNLWKDIIKVYIRAVNYTKTLIHFPEVESIFLAMFGKFELMEVKMQFGA